MGLKSKTGDDGSAQDPSKKIKEVAHKRKLMDIVKQQTEEIEFLRDELDRLRAKTFPSFAHLHNKPEYPDEQWSDKLVSYFTFMSIYLSSL